MKARNMGGLAVAMLLSSCDARAGSGYAGESLLRIEGSVVVADPSAPSELVPALAFRDARETLHLLDVEVRGRFPASFRLDVLDRPPAEAFYTASQLLPGATADDPRFALAYIAAVPPDHPERIPLANKEYVFHCDGPELELPPSERSMIGRDHPGLVTEPGHACFRETEACTYDQACYHKVERCDHLYQNCQVIALTGDPELLKTTSQEHFAGLSSNYLVIYLERRAPADSAPARMFAAGKALHAGYHLLELREYDEEELWAYQACGRNANALALERFNAAHGTDYVPPDQPASSPAEEREFGELLNAAATELGCPIAHYSIEPVQPLRRRKISIVLGASDAPPFLWN